MKIQFEEKKNILSEIDPEILLADGFEEALIGYVEIFNKVIALYDREKCLSILEEKGCSPEEAEEYFQFNVIGAWMGEKTPGFATFFKKS